MDVVHEPTGFLAMAGSGELSQRNGMERLWEIIDTLLTILIIGVTIT
jgi:hypothetical protein